MRVATKIRRPVWFGCVAAIAGTLGGALVAVAAPPPLIPRSVLFSNPERDWPQLSPDGRQLAYLAPSTEGVLNVWVRTVGAADDTMITADSRDGIFVFQWAWNGRHLLYLQDRHGDENLHVWSVEVATGIVRDLTPFAGVRAQNLITSAARPDEVLVGLNLRDRRRFDIYRIDLETGASRLDTENPGDVLGWTPDASLTIRAACAFDPTDAHTTIRVRDKAGAPWRDLLQLPFGEAPIIGQTNGGTLILGFAPDGRSLYMASFEGTEMTRLVRVDAMTGKVLETIAKRDNAELAWDFAPDRTARFRGLVQPTTGALQAVAFEEAKVEWHAIDPAVAGDLEAIGKAVSPSAFDIINRDRDDRRWVVLTFRPDKPLTYSIWDRGSKRLEPLFDAWPKMNGLQFAPTESMRIKARDGLSLLAYLTKPPGVEARKLPMVLLVHGGPSARDHWWFDPGVQFLANRGYAVLQVQFRGSSGLGKNYLNSGNGQFGVGTMQHDLTDSVRWAIDKGIADPKRVAIMGGSYGGYATLAGLAFTPELYACGVDLVGPSNMATTLSSFPPYWAPVKKRWVLRVGDVENDRALNERISPIFHADKIRAPLLIGHGTNDPRVKQAESESIVKALRDRDLPVTFVVYPDEGHGFGKPQNNLDFFGRVEEFLAKHVGGRAEPWVKVEGASGEVR